MNVEMPVQMSASATQYMKMMLAASGLKTRAAPIRISMIATGM